jgi:hypothetical protein
MKLKVKRWKKMYLENSNLKKAGIITLITKQVDFKTNNSTRD